MLIHRMRAVFGHLQNQMLELREGLNIIEAPNESGKSTWCAFLTAMFYGTDSREQSQTGKTDLTAEKSHYIPWSGSAMSGQLDCQTEYGTLTLTRTTSQSDYPMRDFQAFHTSSREAIPELTGQNCGEKILGISKELFERSVLIQQVQQTGPDFSQTIDFEQRQVMALSGTETENTDVYQQAAEILKQQQGQNEQLSALEQELENTEQELQVFQELEQQLLDIQKRFDLLTQRESALSEKLSAYDLWEARQSRKIRQEAETAVQEAEANVEAIQQALESEQIPEINAISRLRAAIINLNTVRKSMERAEKERDLACQALENAEASLHEHNPFPDMTPEQAEALPLELDPEPKWPIWLSASLALGMILCLTLATVQKRLLFAAGIGCGVFGAGLLSLAYITTQKKKRWSEHVVALQAQRQKELSEFSLRYHAVQTAKADADVKIAAYQALYDTLSSNEEGVLAEVHRFSPDVSNLSEADEALRTGAVRRKELSTAISVVQKARLRLELLDQQNANSDDPDKQDNQNDTKQTEQSDFEFALASDSETLTLSTLPGSPIRARESAVDELERVRTDLSAARSELDRCTVKLRTLEEPAVLNSIQANLKEQIAHLESEYAAIQLALDALEAANKSWQCRVPPAIRRRTAEIFAELTDHRHQNNQQQSLPDSIAQPSALSAGTSEQLYLAMRLSICELILPSDNPIPIILDDVLGDFDDVRCQAALRYLRRIAETRQVILFTCHSREADFFAGDPSVFVQRFPTVQQGRQEPVQAFIEKPAEIKRENETISENIKI